MAIDPLLLDVPIALRTARLRLRPPCAGDGAIVLPAVRSSLAELSPWLPWAVETYGQPDAERWCRKSAGEFLLRASLQFLIFEQPDRHVGNVGLFAFDWDVGECEIGYWLDTARVGHGIMSEAVSAICELATGHLSMRRLIIRTDAENRRSREVARRCAFALEGTFHQSRRDSHGRLRSECVFARIVSAPAC